MVVTVALHRTLRLLKGHYTKFYTLYEISIQIVCLSIIQSNLSPFHFCVHLELYIHSYTYIYKCTCIILPVHS